MSSAQSEKKPADKPTELSEERTDLAFERTRWAADRTLMAWVRTALSLISIGFTFFSVLDSLAAANAIELDPGGARNVGLTLISLGLILLVIASLQNLSFMKRLITRFGYKFKISLAQIAAFAVAVIGVLMFLSVFFGVGPF